MNEYLLKLIKSEGSHPVLPYFINAKMIKMLLSKTTSAFCS